MDDSYIQLPLNIEEVLNVKYDGEDTYGDKYDPEENIVITKWMQSGLKKDKGRYYKSGCSIGNIQAELDAMYDPKDYKEVKNGVPIHRRSKGALYKQITRLSLPISALHMLAYYEVIAPLKPGEWHRRVYRDCLAEKLRLSELGINKLTTGEYEANQIDTSVIIRDKLSQHDVDQLDMLNKSFPCIKINLKSQSQWDEQLEKEA